MNRTILLIIVELIIVLAVMAFVRSNAYAAPIVTFAWDPYPVSATQNTGANKFVLETKIDTGAYVAAPDITPITATTVAIDLVGRTGNAVTGRLKACRPSGTGTECSSWSNEATKTIVAPNPPTGVRIQ